MFPASREPSTKKHERTFFADINLIHALLVCLRSDKWQYPASGADAEVWRKPDIRLKTYQQKNGGGRRQRTLPVPGGP